MATFLQLFGDRLDAELGSADRTELFTTVKRKDAINQAQLEFVKQTECYTKTVSVALVDDTREYDLDAVGIVSALDFLWIATGGVEFSYYDGTDTTYVSGDDDFPFFTVMELNRNEPSWRASAKTRYPDGWYLREASGSQYVGFKTPPKIDATHTAALLVPYVAVPPDMSADADEPFTAGSDIKKILRPWHQGLVHYAAALLEPLRKNYDGEQRQRQLFAGIVADYLQRKRPRNGGKIAMSRDYYADARQGRVAGAWATERF